MILRKLSEWSVNYLDPGCGPVSVSMCEKFVEPYTYDLKRTRIQ